MREISAGGVVIRKEDGVWWVAAIELPLASDAAPDPGKPAVRSKPKAVLCLPKGLIDPGEKALDAALREVREETGIIAAPITKLGDIKYVYVRSWGDGERVFKIVSFYLLRYESGQHRQYHRRDANRSRPRQVGSLDRCSPSAGVWRRETNGAPGTGICRGQRRAVIPALDKFLPEAITITSSQLKSSVFSVPSVVEDLFIFRGLIMKRINKVAILGAGTMGARIAAHFANAGVPSYLFDIVPPDADGRPRATKLPPPGSTPPRNPSPPRLWSRRSPASSPSAISKTTSRNSPTSTGSSKPSSRISIIKRALLRKVEAVRKPGTIVTTNTSGLPVGKIAEGFSDEFRWAWFGTHFFNPPRYMRLLEIIPTPEADRAAIDAVAHFCDVRLGKGVVIAKDTPNFIGNRIGTFSVLNVMRLMQEMGLTIEEVDALTGQAVGWPRSATFRTIDLVGLDILGHVVGNMTKNVHDERSDLRLPDFFGKMLEHKWLGDKTKGGFYKKERGAGALARQL